MKAAEFEMQCNFVHECANNLRACPRGEQINEANILRTQLNELLAAKLDRKNDRLQDRRVQVMYLADQSLAASGC